MAVVLSLALAFVPAPIELNLKVEGTDRRAIVYRPANASKATPLVFVWHGFTGNAKHAAFAYHLHTAWPEATVVYPQGLDVQLLGKTAPGWQIAPRMQGDRDLKFYDALLAKVQADYGIDKKRVYTCGMSNGAFFSYVLLTARSSTLAAAAPVGGATVPAFRGAPAMPILITHGKNDPLIKIGAAEQCRDAAIANNKASDKTREWMKGYTLYPGASGKDVVYHVHDGGHDWPSTTSDAIVKFFKEH